MKIGLVNIEPKIINTATMQIANAHREKGDTVEWAIPLEYDKYDRLYCSSLFTFTDKSHIPAGVICGGTGFNIGACLPQWIERAKYDYSIYPDCDYSIVWTSRGCVRKCPFCVVPDKEGGIHPVEIKDLNPNGSRIVVQDNNFFASPKWRAAIKCLREMDQPIDFQGVDIRLMTAERYRALASTSLVKDQAIKIAWDDPRIDIRGKLSEMLKYIPARKIKCYVLIGYWSTQQQDIERVRTLWDDYRILPYVMSYNESSPYQKAFERWVNSYIFKNLSWHDYKYRKDFNPAIDRASN